MIRVSSMGSQFSFKCPTMASSSSTKVILMCYGGEVMEVHEALVNASPTLKSLIREKGVDGDNKINLPNISIETMCKINEYVKKHAEAVDPAKNLDAWDEEFIKVGLDTLYDLLQVSFISYTFSCIIINSFSN